MEKVIDMMEWKRRRSGQNGRLTRPRLLPASPATQYRPEPIGDVIARLMARLNN